ncbi:MAG TPA: tyrosinase family protein [Actinomycetota bacterium]|nr:tyrosinase family protein [Actinomycetota bacterium]
MNSGEQILGSIRPRPEVVPGLKLPPLKQAVRIRRDIWKLEEQQEWHPVTRAYAEAIRIMKARQDTDPTSLAYQAGIHGHAQTDQWLNTCQHRSWYFLPWHRMYLYWFELICRAAIKSSPNVDDKTKSNWALPYWNYDRGTPTNTIPPAFRAETTPDGDPNPLFVPGRLMNDGSAMPDGPEGVTTPTAALAKHHFTGGDAGPANTGGFGGPQTGFHHGGGINGALENVPHNTVHGEVGGFMWAFDTAGLDPIFWLHHCNIDRLWEVWDRQTNPSRENPTDAAWTTNQVFHFRNTSGADVTQTSGGVVDTKNQLSYVYDQFSGPVFKIPFIPIFKIPRLPIPPRPEGFADMTEEPPADRPVELAGATEEPVRLSGDTVETQISLGGATAFRDASAEPDRVYLNVEQVTAEGPVGTNYSVYVNIPDDDETTEDNYHVGHVSLFGAAEASDPESDHQEGLRFVFDITDLYRALKESGAWDESRLKVTLKPVRRRTSDGAAFTGAESPQLPAASIGRVSVFYQ